MQRKEENLNLLKQNFKVKSIGIFGFYARVNSTTGKDKDKIVIEKA